MVLKWQDSLSERFHINKVNRTRVVGEPLLLNVDLGDTARNFLSGWIDVWYGFCTTCSLNDSTYENKDRAKGFETRSVGYKYVTP